MMAYWVNLQGHGIFHPSKTILQDCWEPNTSDFHSFGWIGNVKAENIGLGNIKYSPTVPSSTIPPCDVVCDAISRFKYPAIEKEV